MTGHLLTDAARIRPVVWERQGGLCAGCGTGMHPGAWEAHHRQRRRILGWCACNVLGLHPGCHNQGDGSVHGNPDDARDRGLIVSAFSDEPPCRVPVAVHWPWIGPALLGCDGMAYSALSDPPDCHT